MIENITLRQKDCSFLIDKYPLTKVMGSPSVWGAANLYTALFGHECLEQLKLLNKTNKKILALLEKDENDA